MSRFNYSRRIRDPIHDYIKVSEEERKLIDTLPFQRLRRIKQSGISSMVYPSSTHSRFSHSIGVMHLAGMFADSLELGDNEYRTLRIAGLLHDIGHGPFSHTSDRVAQKNGYNHEERSCEIIDEKLREHIPQDIDIRKVKDYILGESEINIIAGDIDADRIDYLNRDTVNTGLDYGIIDYHTIIEFSRIVDGQLVFERKAIDALSEMLSARRYMHNATINHHVSRLTDAMLEKCLDKYVDINSVEEMMQHNDYTMHTKLSESDNKKINNIYDKIRRRDLPKITYTIRGDEARKEVMEYLANVSATYLENKISMKVNANQDEIIVVTPRLPKTSSLDVKIYKDGSVVDLEDISVIPRHLSKERLQQSRFHVYTTEDQLEEVRKATDTILRDEVGYNK